MAVKIKLKRLGKIRAPQYRIVVADARTKREGRAIEEIGKYHPKDQPSFIEVDSERVRYWLSVGAQPTEPVLALLKVTGDWQRFKGEPPPPPMKVPEPSPDRLAVFDAAAKEAAAEPKGAATTSKSGKGRKGEKKSEDTGGASAAKPSAKPSAEGPAADNSADEKPAGVAEAEPSQGEA